MSTERNQIDEFEVMPPTKIRGFFLEFPWLVKYCKQDETGYVYASKIDAQDLLDFPDEMWEGSTVDARRVSTVIILDKDGNELIRVQPKSARSARRWWQLWEVPPQVTRDDFETLNACLDRLALGSAGRNSAYFVLVIIEFESHPTAIEVIKSPKGKHLLQWREEEIQRERAQIVADISDGPPPVASSAES